MSTLCIPPKILDQHVVALGKTGAGKSSALRHLVEWLLDQKKRVVIADVKGDWWGLKSSADGKGAGYGVIAFGDFKEESASDVPINRSSGAHVAELVAQGNRPCVIGFRGWAPADRTQFWIDFAQTLFARNRGELFLVIDEVHNYAPKGRLEDPQAAKCLNRTNTLLAEGRGLGIVCLIASQRPQKVHNDTLTSCETLVAMRVIHSADRKAIREWIDGCGDDTQGKQVLDGLAGLARGTAFVWSPEIGFGPEKVSFPMFRTFDSFAPPQLQRRINSSGWADVDLGAVKEKLAAVIEEAKNNDPKFLRSEVARLQRELTKAPAKVEVAKVKIQEVPVFSSDERSSLDKAQKMIGELRPLFAEVVHVVEKLGLIATARVAPIVRPSDFDRTPNRRQVAGPVTHAGDALTYRAKPPAAPAGNRPLSTCEQKILRVLAQFRDEGCTIGKLALLSGYRISGGFRNSLGYLRTDGTIEGQNVGTIRITDAGMALGPFDPLPTGAALRQYWLTHPSFGTCERKIMEYLFDNGPTTIDKLSTGTGYSISGGFRNALGYLRTAGVIVGQNTSEMRPNDDLL
jgi:uncharacterized protein